MTPKKPKFIGEAPVINRLVGSPGEGKIVGTAKLEEMPSGEVIAHIDASGMTGEMLRRGFSFGSFSIKEDDYWDIDFDENEGE